MSNITFKGEILSVDSWDSKPMHDFSDSSDWDDPADSAFVMQPPADEIWVVHSVRMRYSVNADMKPMTVKYYIHKEMAPPSTDPVLFGSSAYPDNNSFIGRFNRINVLPLAGNGEYTHNAWDISYDFNEPIILKGTFDNQDPGLIKFSMGIDDNQAIQPLPDTGDIGLVEVRYPDVAIYKIPEELLT